MGARRTSAPQKSCGMKVVTHNICFLSNCEVLQLLNERLDSTAGIPPVVHSRESEVKVQASLKDNGTQTVPRSQLEEFNEAMKQYKLTTCEVLQVMNARPTTQVEMYLIVEDCEDRLSDEEVDRLLADVERLL